MFCRHWGVVCVLSNVFPFSKFRNGVALKRGFEEEEKNTRGKERNSNENKKAAFVISITTVLPSDRIRVLRYKKAQQTKESVNLLDEINVNFAVK